MAPRMLSAPDYLLCCDCETPCYIFEWKDGAVKEALCEICGNEDEMTFLTEEEYDAYADSSSWDYAGR